MQLQLVGQTRSDYIDRMTILNITEVKSTLSEVIDRVERGEVVVVTRMGTPVARISAYSATKHCKRLGQLEGQASIPDDFDKWPEQEARALGIID